MIIYLIEHIVHKYLRRRMREGKIDLLMMDLTKAAREVWYEDNVFTVSAHLKEHLNNALHYEYQYLGDLP